MLIFLKFITFIYLHWQMIVSTVMLSSGTVWAAWVFVAKKWVGKMVDTRFDKGIQTHKHELDKVLEEHKQRLNILTEMTRFDIQRKTTDFNIYTNKRHTIYSELYSLMLFAQGEVVGQTRGGTLILTFEEYDRDDIENYMDQQGIVAGKQREVIALWESEKQRAIKILRDYLTVLEKAKVRRKLHEYKHFLLLNELYITEVIADKAWLIFRLMSELLTHVEHPTFGEGYSKQLVKMSGLEEEILKEIEGIKAMMRMELAIADYDSEQ